MPSISHPPVAAPARHASLPAGVLLADVLSYGYAFAFVIATLAFDLQFQLWQGIAITALFVVLRAVAREIRRDAVRSEVRRAERHADAIRRSPARWTAAQRDGHGRYVDSIA